MRLRFYVPLWSRFIIPRFASLLIYAIVTVAAPCLHRNRIASYSKLNYLYLNVAQFRVIFVKMVICLAAIFMQREIGACWNIAEG